MCFSLCSFLWNVFLIPNIHVWTKSETCSRKVSFTGTQVFFCTPLACKLKSIEQSHIIIIIDCFRLSKADSMLNDRTSCGGLQQITHLSGPETLNSKGYLMLTLKANQLMCVKYELVAWSHFVLLLLKHISNVFWRKNMFSVNSVVEEIWAPLPVWQEVVQINQEGVCML